MNKECAEFRRNLDPSSGSADESLARHLDACPKCAAYLEWHISGTPAGLDRPAWEPAPASIGHAIYSTPSKPADSDFWHNLIAALSGLALAAAVFFIAVRTAPLPVIRYAAPVSEPYSFLDSGAPSFSGVSFIEETPEENPGVTEVTFLDSNEWTFLEQDSYFSFLENDKEAVWEDQSNG